MRRFDVTDIWVGDYDLPDGHVCSGIPSLRTTGTVGSSKLAIFETGRPVVTDE